MHLPGYTAEASLRGSRVLPHQQRMIGRGGGRGEVTPQLPLDPSKYVRQLGRDVCRTVCNVLYSGCLDSCEGTIDNPKPSRNCLLCDDRHNSCLQVCG